MRARLPTAGALSFYTILFSEKLRFFSQNAGRGALYSAIPRTHVCPPAQQKRHNTRINTIKSFCAGFLLVPHLYGNSIMILLKFFSFAFL